MGKGKGTGPGRPLKVEQSDRRDVIIGMMKRGVPVSRIHDTITRRYDEDISLETLRRYRREHLKATDIVPASLIDQKLEQFSIGVDVLAELEAIAAMQVERVLEARKLEKDMELLMAPTEGAIASLRSTLESIYKKKKELGLLEVELPEEDGDGGEESSEQMVAVLLGAVLEKLSDSPSSSSSQVSGFAVVNEALKSLPEHEDEDEVVVIEEEPEVILDGDEDEEVHEG